MHAPPDDESHIIHLQSSYSGGRILEQYGFDTSWGWQSFDRWVDCVTTCNPALEEEPD